MSTIGDRIRARRMELSYTQEYLAEQVDISSTYCSILERGIANPSLEVIVRIANALDVVTNHLFGNLLHCNDKEIVGKLIIALLCEIKIQMRHFGEYDHALSGRIEMDYIKLGERVRYCRRMKTLTQGQLAKKSGISSSFLGHIERGSRKVSVETLISIANELGVGTDYLLVDSLVSTNTGITPELTHILARVEEIIQYINDKLDGRGEPMA